MPTLLRVDSSPMFQASVSRRLTEEFVRRWEALHPGGKLIARDLTRTELASVTAEWVRAAYTPEESRSPEQRQLLAVSDSLIAELEAADEYVIGVPMHNFSIPSTVNLWIDLIAAPAKLSRTWTVSPKASCKERGRRFLSHRVESTIQERRWHRSTSWSPIYAPYLHFWVLQTPHSSRPAGPQRSDRVASTARLFCSPM
jgi:hypothetical protein